MCQFGSVNPSIASALSINNKTGLDRFSSIIKFVGRGRLSNGVIPRSPRLYSQFVGRLELFPDYGQSSVGSENSQPNTCNATCCKNMLKRFYLLTVFGQKNNKTMMSNSFDLFFVKMCNV